MKTNCLNCKTEFEAKRKTAKYCSAKCRKLAFLGNSVLGTVKDSVPAKKTPNGYVMGEIVASERNRKVGFCTWCQKEIKASAGYGDNWDLVECCYECVKIRNPKK